MKTMLTLLPIVFSMSIIPYQELQASPSAVIQSSLRSSTQAITRPVRKQIQLSLAKYRTKSNLNMRSKPKGKVIVTLNKGASVTVLEQSKGNWWLVNYNEQKGWVHSDYLEQI